MRARIAARQQLGYLDLASRATRRLRGAHRRAEAGARCRPPRAFPRTRGRDRAAVAARLGAPNVTVRSARTARRAIAPVSASTPVGRSTAITCVPASSICAAPARRRRSRPRVRRAAPCRAARRRRSPSASRDPNERREMLAVARGDGGRARRRSSSLEAAERVAADASRAHRCRPTHDLGAARPQVARGDESVAAVVAGAREDVSDPQSEHRARSAARWPDDTPAPARSINSSPLACHAPRSCARSRARISSAVTQQHRARRHRGRPSGDGPAARALDVEIAHAAARV